MPPYLAPDKRWRYRFVWAGKRYSGSAPKGSNTKRTAEALEREHIAKLERRGGPGPMPTVRDFAPRFLEYQRAHTKPLTFELHATVVDKHIVPHLGRLELDDVTKAEIHRVVLLWRRTAAPRTCNTRLGVLLRMLSLAVEWDIMTAAPRVKSLKVDQDHPRFLSEPEATALLQAAADWPQWWPMVFVALRTGLRVGELRGLHWGDVDLRAAKLAVRRTDPGRADMAANSPKGNRPRIVPLTPDTVDALATWQAKLRKTGPGDWVFPAPDTYKGKSGRVRSRSARGCGQAFDRIRDAAGLDDEVTWHTLRHTYASWLVMRGVPLRVVQDLLGHATIKLTERYAHLAPGFASQSVVASLDVPLVTGGAKMLTEGE